jgi:hypothetical protein
MNTVVISVRDALSIVMMKAKTPIIPSRRLPPMASPVAA